MTRAAVTIEDIRTAADLRAEAAMIGEYLDFVTAELDRHFGVRVDPDPLIAKTLEDAHRFLPPQGVAFLARDEGGRSIGMAFLRPCGVDGFEIKRLYVRPEARGAGAGRALVLRLLDHARGAGGRAMYLDSTRNLAGAIALYQSLGFVFCDPYPESDHFGDEAMAPALVFMRRDLTPDGGLAP